MLAAIRNNRILLMMALLSSVVLIGLLCFAHTASAQATEPPSGTLGWIGSLFGFSEINDIFEWIFAWLATQFLSMVGLLLWVAGIILNQTVVIAVTRMGETLGQTSAIATTWTLLRDLANIFLIFSFLVIGIATILQIANYSYRRLLAKLIVIALLINFSLFFTQLIIDTSNLLSLGIYNQIAQSSPAVAAGDCDGASVWSLDCGDGGLSDAFMQQLRLTTIYNNDAALSVDPDSANFVDDIFYVAIGGSILILATAFVFFAVAILLLIRFIVLVFLMVLSPLAFAAMALPGLERYAREWWRTLFKHAFFAPLFFLTMLIALRIMEGTGGAANGGLGAGVQGQTFAGAVAGQDSFIATFISFFVVIGFLIAGLVISQRMGVQGANTMIQWGHITRKFGLDWLNRGTVQPVKHLAQRTAGRIERSETFDKYAEKATRVRVPLIGKLPKVGKWADRATNLAGTGVAMAARSGMQRAAAGYRADVEQRRGEISNYRTGELLRRLQTGVLPTTRPAMIAELARREDLDELELTQARVGKKLLQMAGMSTLNMDKFRPDTGENVTEKRNNVGKLRSGDVGNVDKLKAVLGTPTDGRTEQDVLELSDAFIHTLNSGGANALARRGDDLSKAYLDRLFTLAAEQRALDDPQGPRRKNFIDAEKEEKEGYDLEGEKAFAKALQEYDTRESHYVGKALEKLIQADRDTIDTVELIGKTPIAERTREQQKKYEKALEGLAAAERGIAAKANLMGSLGQTNLKRTLGVDGEAGERAKDRREQLGGDRDNSIPRHLRRSTGGAGGSSDSTPNANVSTPSNQMNQAVQNSLNRDQRGPQT